MFKEILASVLLSASIGAQTLKEEHPKYNWIGSTYVINGQYTIKDTYNINEMEYAGTDTRVTVNSYNDQKSITIFGSYDNGVTWKTYNCNGFSLRLPLRSIGSPNYTGTITIYTDEYDEKITITGEKTIDQYTHEGDMWDFIRNFVITFNDDYYLTDVEGEIFTDFFTKAGNRYVQNYTGYYHYAGTTGWWENYDFDFQGGLYIIDNVMYNAYYHDAMNVGFSNTSNNQYVNFMSSGLYVKSPTNIYMTTMLPDYVNECMSAEGVFTYIQEPTQPTTFQDFFLGIMDAPLYYLWSLFDWHLFGINLFVAFCGLVTMALVIAIVKKVY